MLRVRKRHSKLVFCSLIASVIVFGSGLVIISTTTLSRSPDEMALKTRTASGASAFSVSSQTSELAHGIAKRVQIEAANDVTPIPGDCDLAKGHSDPSKISIIANKQHCLTPLWFEPALTTVSCGGDSATVATTAKEAFDELCAASRDAGQQLGVTSSYRSYSDQVDAYQYWVNLDGVSAADRYSARPGYSEHQTGLSVDFRSLSGGGLDAFTGSPEQKWIAENGWKYGWIQRYTAENSNETGYSPETWHWRYVGKDVAAKMHERGPSSSLETLWNISGGSSY